MAIYEELVYDELVDIAPIYVRINIDKNSNFYYLGNDDGKHLHIILEQIKDIELDYANPIIIQKFLKNDQIFVQTLFLNIGGILKESKLFKIPNNPASCYQPIFLKDLNKIILGMDPEYDIVYSGIKSHQNSAYKPREKIFGKYQDYIKLDI